MESFEQQLAAAIPALRPYALRLWPNAWDREDGLQATTLRALENSKRFTGGNLVAWLTTMMGNIRKDEYSKGYRKGRKPDGDGDRLVYAGGTDDYATGGIWLCDPESILIAREGYAK